MSDSALATMDQESLKALLSYATQLSYNKWHSNGLPVPCHDADLEEISPVLLDEKLTLNKITRTISPLATPSISQTTKDLHGLAHHLCQIKKEFTMRELFGTIIQRRSRADRLEMDYSRGPKQWPVGLLSEVLALSPVQIAITGIVSHQQLSHVCQSLLAFTDSLHMDAVFQIDESIASSIMAWHEKKGNSISVHLYSYRDDAESATFDLPIDCLRCHDLRSNNVSICQRYLNSFARPARSVTLYTGEMGNAAFLDLSALVTNGTTVESDIPVVINATCVLQSLTLTSTALLQSDIQCRCDKLYLRGNSSSRDVVKARVEELCAIIARTQCSFFNPDSTLLQELLSTCILPSVRRIPVPLEKLDLAPQAHLDVLMLQGVRRCFPNAVWLARGHPMAALSNFYSMGVRPLDTTDIKWLYEAAWFAGTGQRLVELLHLVCGLHVSQLELPRAVVIHLVRACLISTQS
eukprot:TRINITY_DN10654_c0_g1_i2.p1 TRINITY_DN10654_c0_g1~~TRINITY_DN10654_c0_g1_i2.p1  ORF type:complete len:465 (+),score=59.28 TRINITY_DN10654_c0_g1_i2:1162-2556(+)